MNALKKWTLGVFALALGCCVYSCKDETPQPDLVPHVPVYVPVNLNSQQFINLHTINHVYLEEGFRGIILYKESQNVYRAFERACAFHATDPCARVEVHESNFFMFDPCCGSQYNFFGDPISGKALIPLRQYFTLLDGHYLYISNEPMR
jgi:hypothetical protein